MQLNNEKTVKGDKVKTTFRPMDGEEAASRRQVVSQVVAKAMRRLQERPQK
jgi:hypothetical protein